MPDDQHLQEPPSPIPKVSYTSTTTAPTNDDDANAQHRPLTPRLNLSTHLRGDIDPEAATLSLIAYCFMTGFMYVSLFFEGFFCRGGTDTCRAVAIL